jgi:type II secretory pathway pseudopilin PulG
MSCRAGLTFIEIFVVLIILVLIASLGIPTLRGTLARNELKYSAEQVRGELLNTRVHAMEDGQIFCIRAQIGGSKFVVTRVLDTHFSAGLSSRQTTSRFDYANEYDPFEKGGFTGEIQDDFFLRDPDSVVGDDVIQLPGSVIIADVIAVAEERSAFYLGLVPTENTRDTDEMFQIEALAIGELRLGETAGGNGGMAWSAPIFFYPDGSTSTAAILLKNTTGRCIEIRLRGLTGTSTVTAITMTTDYVGELQADRL